MPKDIPQSGTKRILDVKLLQPKTCHRYDLLEWIHLLDSYSSSQSISFWNWYVCYNINSKSIPDVNNRHTNPTNEPTNLTANMLSPTSKSKWKWRNCLALYSSNIQAINAYCKEAGKRLGLNSPSFHFMSKIFTSYGCNNNILWKSHTHKIIMALAKDNIKTDSHFYIFIMRKCWRYLCRSL